MVRQADRRETTQRRILDAARTLFLEHGYHATTTQMILETTGLSKGALYHHFESKADIFEMIFSETSQKAIAAANQKVTDDKPALARLKLSALAWLNELRQPDVAKILLELGPEALGWNRARAIEEAQSLPFLIAGLEAAIHHGEIKIASTPITARFINAVLAEAAFLYLEQGEASWPDIEQSLSDMVDRLVA